MEEQQRSTEPFSIVRRAKSLTHATRGVWVFMKTTHNAWVHAAVIVVGVLMGLYFHISYIDWMFLILASGLVLSAEAFNTAIEIDIDLTSPQYHPYARDTKDVAAGAVLIIGITGYIIGFIIFGHYLVDVFF